MTMNAIPIHLELSEAELNILLANLEFLRQRYTALREEIRYTANPVRYCVLQAETIAGLAVKVQAAMDESLVLRSTACPTCGERRMDCLTWTPAQTVHCATCGGEYDPNE